MDRHLEKWFNAIKGYMHIMDNTIVYRASVEMSDAKEIMEAMGFTSVEIDWYDGLIINANRDGCRFNSAWCMNEHVIMYDSPKYNFNITIHETKYHPEYADRPVDKYYEPENQYKFFRHGVIKGDIPKCYMEFMNKLVEFCNELTENDPNEIVYIARMCLK